MTKTKKKTPGRPKKTTAKEVKKMKALNPGKGTGKGGESPPLEGDVLEDVKYDGFGRPSVITSEVKKLLLEAFAWGCSYREAALHSGIAYKTLTNYFEKDADFKERCLELQDTPTLKARGTLVEAVAKSAYYALKYLERKKSGEFSLRVKQTFEDPEPLTPEEEEALDDVIDENL